MNWTEFNWLHLGYAIWIALWAAFLMSAFKRKWTAFALLIGVGNMLIAMLHSVAPFRGALDPNYVGYNFLVLHAPRGLIVTAVAGTILVLSFTAALVAINDLRGTAMRFLSVWSGFLTALFGIPLLIGVVTDPTSFSIDLGEYASIPWYLAHPLLFGLVVLPFAFAVPWAHRRATRN